MSYHISQTNPSTMATEDLLAEISGFKALAVEVVERLALILKELRSRRQPHPFFYDRIMCFWQSIEDGSLDAEAAVLLANRHTIKAILPLPKAEQREIARGKEVAVAIRQSDGSIVRENMPIMRMDQPKLSLVFGAEKVRSFSEQADILRHSGNVERIGMVTVLRSEQLLKIGNQKIRPEDLEGPLKALGYRLVLSREKISA